MYARKGPLYEEGGFFRCGEEGGGGPRGAPTGKK